MPWLWRSDADLVRELPATRRIMPFIMRTRTESAVYFEQHIDISQARQFLAKQRAEHNNQATLLHLFIWAAARTLKERPRLNRFTAGTRLWQRRGIWISFSAKKAKSDDHPIVVIKKRVDPELPFHELVAQLTGSIHEGRSDKASRTDKELALLFLLPNVLLSLFVKLAMRLDAWGWLPKSFIDGDPMFASLFVANLGSLGMDPGFHHLYEWGNIPIFATLGQAKASPSHTEEGESPPQLMPIRYSFDERVEDGLYCLTALEHLKAIMENPEAHL